MVRLCKDYIRPFVGEDELNNIAPMVSAAFNLLHERSGPGADYLGWIDLPVNFDRDELERIKSTAGKIRSMCDVFVIIGIGGSYLGSRAVIEFIKSEMYNRLGDSPEIYFAGNNISPVAMANILRLCRGRRVCINVFLNRARPPNLLLLSGFSESCLRRPGGKRAPASVYSSPPTATREILGNLPNRRVIPHLPFLPISAAGTRCSPR